MAAYFSIIIPLYNKEKHIRATIESVLAQTFTDYEIIVVNDGSTDKGQAIVNSIKDKRLRLFNLKNQGVSHARNYGISKATSRLIVFLDADDLWKTNHLQNLKSLYEAFPNCGLYATAYAKQYHKTTIRSVYKNIPTSPAWMGIVNDFFESSLINCIAWTSAVMIPKSTLEVVGTFDENITLGAGEDTDLWIRIAIQYPVAFSNTVTATHVLHAQNRVSNYDANRRQFINLDTYENTAKTNENLKRFLDLNRFSIAIQYKLADNDSKARSLIENIDPVHLSNKQRALLKLNRRSLKIALTAKRRLQNLRIL